LFNSNHGQVRDNNTRGAGIAVNLVNSQRQLQAASGC
jgi:hypothetical protein